MDEETKKVTLVVDGRETEATLHEPVLGVAERLGIHIPSLCHHDALEPLGACRLCLVEVVKNGRRKLTTSCNCPAEEGIEVFTSTETVAQHRRMVVELLLARCPEVPAIAQLAREMGVKEARFPSGDETCIVCGLCTRVCETYATSAIAVMNRGEKKAIGAPADETPSDCVGCGACAEICPTGHIASERRAGKLAIWDREFPLAVCGVNDGRCVACGVCEEACPFSVPRVVLHKNGAPKAEIDVSACRGCGVCLAACPCGAIEQPRAMRSNFSGGLKKRALVIACPRSGFGISPRLPDSVDLVELPCVGGASPAMLLGALARGYDGVIVLGRHQETCRLAGAEDHARAVVDRIDRLAGITGLGSGRAVFKEPAPGRDGPSIAIAEFLKDLRPTPLEESLPDDVPTELPGDAANILGWLLDRGELKSNGDPARARIDLEGALPWSPVYRFAESGAHRADGKGAIGSGRIASHPILTPEPRVSIDFTFNGEKMTAREGEMISSALFAVGITIFGHHHRDGGAQGIFCANGQCSQCSVLADNRLVKACMVPVLPGMKVESCEGLPPLPADDAVREIASPGEVSV
ncbi:MAG: 4Fe-4S dicluster domain-containing protein, partial [Deltaproteobacteria bacterium]|nr:4Fe-4S dicluster domain-containing protein [Deltaproteobacteria bacterium]